MKKKKILAFATASREQMQALCAQIANDKLTEIQLSADKDHAVQAVEHNFAGPLAAVREMIDNNLDQAAAWAEANPAAFGDSRSIDFGAAIAAYRKSPPKLETRKGVTWEGVLRALKTKLLAGYIRIKEEVNRQALISDRELIGADRLRDLGVEVVQEETFNVEPKITQVETTETKTMEDA